MGAHEQILWLTTCVAEPLSESITDDDELNVWFYSHEEEWNYDDLLPEPEHDSDEYDSWQYDEQEYYTPSDDNVSINMSIESN